MTFSVENFFLEFNTPFEIAHGTRTGTDIVLLKIEHKGITAFGEASLPPYLAENTSSVNDFIERFLNSNDFQLSDLQGTLAHLHSLENNFAAKACIDIALHNWYATAEGVSLHQFLDIPASPVPYCTFTIATSNESEIKKKVEESDSFHILKVKLGTGNDKKIIETIRKYTGKDICVDANQGWKNARQALEMLSFLKDQNVLFAEQPLPKDMVTEQKELFAKSPLPLYADESAQGPDDVPQLKGLFHGINVKLMKCGGISKGLEMIRRAKAGDFKVMIGSMSETGCAIKAASQLSALADVADLDGPLLTKNNPFNIVHYRNGKLMID